MLLRALWYPCLLVGAVETTPSVVDVFVEPCACAQDGLVLRFIRVGDESRAVEAVRYLSEDSRGGVWRVSAALDAEATKREPARTMLVERGEGQAMLIEGGTHGLVLDPEDAAGTEPVRIAYLLVDRDAIVR